MARGKQNQISMIQVQDPVMEYLNDIIRTYIKKPMWAALTVTGHDYWVVLEYGSGPAETGPREPSPSDGLVISIPANIPGPKSIEEHDVVVAGEDIVSKWYPIKARTKRPMYFIDKHGRQRIEMLVYHPGIKARGFLRNAIKMWQFNVLKDLKALEKDLDDTLPERDDLVKLINFHFRRLLAEVKRVTPVNNDNDPRRDPTPLADSWGIIEAQ